MQPGHTSSGPKIAIAGQIAEVQRELALRRNTYPRLIAGGKLRQAEAELCTRRREAVLETLLFCQRHEADIRQFMAGKQEAMG